MRSGDAEAAPTRFHGRMHVTAARHTVALGVVPRLLSDTLRFALSEIGLDVVPADGRSADVAVVSPSAVGLARARVVVRLPDGADGGVGTVTVDGRRREVVLDSLAAVLDAVRAHC